jgi:hypothetical protein
MEGKLLGLDYDLLVTLIGLLVAGMAAIIGIWVERDAKRPIRYAVWLSVLIALATFVGMFQTYDDDQDQKKVEADLARVLQQLDKIATDNDVEIPELNDLIKTELAAQSRTNPNVVNEFAQRVSDEGDNPSDVVGAYLPAAEVEKIERKGTFKPKPRAKPEAPLAVAPKEEATPSPGAPPLATPESRKERRRKLSFGGGPAKLLTPPKPEAKEEPKKEEPKEEPKQEEVAAPPKEKQDAQPSDPKPHPIMSARPLVRPPALGPQPKPTAAPKAPTLRRL